jgi:hypothetical protein
MQEWSENTEEGPPPMSTVDDTFAITLQHHFPGAILEAQFVADTADSLRDKGFTNANTLTAVSVCRDEIARSLFVDVEDRWGPTFSLASLAGMVTAGRTGISAALSHAPADDGPKHIVVYAMPHIAIDGDGTIGRVHRPGQAEASSACGSLLAFHERLLDGYTQIGVDRFDAEQSLLGHRLQPMIDRENVPDLVELTKMAATAIESDLMEIIDEVLAQTRDAAEAPPNGATFTGIQVHGPGNTNYVWPRTARIVVGGIPHDIVFST